MVKRIQNKVVESRLTLPVTMVYAAVVWLLCGLTEERWWPQLGCFALATYLMVELNNQNVLIRIYSRMITCAFVLFSCAACFLMPSLRGAVAQTCVVAGYLLLFNTYQNPQSAGFSYYGFLCFGLGSLAYVELLWFVPLLWVLMATCLLSLSWRTLRASLLGLLTPYWFVGGWLIYQHDFTPLTQHLSALTDIAIPGDYSRVSTELVMVVALLVVSLLIGIIHFLRKNYLDKIRTRMLYVFFIWMDFLALLLLAAMPERYDLLLRIVMINTAPLIGHFLSLTATRFTNIAFFLLTGVTLALTAYNLWMMSSLF